MCLWIVIPIKPFSSGKSRLAEHLSLQQRLLLNKNLAENTLTVCKTVKGVERILIASRGKEMHRFAVKCGVDFIEEPPGGINIALETAANHAREHHAARLLVLHADLPSIRAAEIETLIDACSAEQYVCIVSDHHHTGTNALMMRPPGVIPFLFGVGSFARHLQAARNRQVEIRTMSLPSLAFDLDTVDDLEYAVGRDLLPREWIEKLGLEI